MYAVIRSGGKQHRVVEGEILNLEKIDIPAGDSLDFDQVLMLGDDGDVNYSETCPRPLGVAPQREDGRRVGLRGRADGRYGLRAGDERGGAAHRGGEPH